MLKRLLRCGAAPHGRSLTGSCIDVFGSRGFDAEANVVRDSIRALIEKSGFREYYNPFTGEGYGARNFTWSGLVVDMN